MHGFDEAAIFTIHGFCQRALQDSAFEAGGDFDAELTQDDREVLDALLDKYADEGIAAIEDTDVLKVQPLTQMGSAVELMKSFGGSKLQYQDAMSQLGRAIYQPSQHGHP